MAFASKRWHFYLIKRKVAAFNETARLPEVVCSASLNHRVTRAGVIWSHPLRKSGVVRLDGDRRQRSWVSRGWKPPHSLSGHWFQWLTALVVENRFCDFSNWHLGFVVCVCVLLPRSSGKSFSLFSLLAHQVLEGSSKVAHLPPLRKPESRWLFQRLLARMCSQFPAIVLALCWACSSFCFLYWGAHSRTQHVGGILVAVKWKERTACAHVTQNRSSVCGKVHKTLVAIIRAR